MLRIKIFLITDLNLFAITALTKANAIPVAATQNRTTMPCDNPSQASEEITVALRLAGRIAVGFAEVDIRGMDKTHGRLVRFGDWLSL